MAPPRLDTIGEDVLLVILDWLRAIIEQEIDSASKLPAPAPVSSGSTDSKDQDARVLALKKTMLSLSSLNHRFRLIIAPEACRKLVFVQKCDNKNLSSLLQTLESSKMFLHCLR